MPFREHSGFVVMPCADWAHTTDFESDRPLSEVDSRMRDFVLFVKGHPGNPRRIDPHIVRNEAPVEIIAKPTGTGAILTANPTVCGPKAWVVIADLHSDCAGYAGAHPEHTGDQFRAQTQRAARHGQHFINTLSLHNGHPMQLILTWTRFGNHRKVEQAGLLRVFTSQVDFPDDTWVDRMPTGIFDHPESFPMNSAFTRLSEETGQPVAAVA